jgi:hypothetical protein
MEHLFSKISSIACRFCVSLWRWKKWSQLIALIQRFRPSGRCIAHQIHDPNQMFKDMSKGYTIPEDLIVSSSFLVHTSGWWCMPKRRIARKSSLCRSISTFLVPLMKRDQFYNCPHTPMLIHILTAAMEIPIGKSGNITANEWRISNFKKPEMVTIGFSLIPWPRHDQNSHKNREDGYVKPSQLFEMYVSHKFRQWIVLRSHYLGQDKYVSELLSSGRTNEEPSNKPGMSEWFFPAIFQHFCFLILPCIIHSEWCFSASSFCCPVPIAQLIISDVRWRVFVNILRVQPNAFPRWHW